MDAMRIEPNIPGPSASGFHSIGEPRLSGRNEQLAASIRGSVARLEERADARRARALAAATDLALHTRATRVTPKLRCKPVQDAVAI